MSSILWSVVHLSIDKIIFNVVGAEDIWLSVLGISHGLLALDHLQLTTAICKISTWFIPGTFLKVNIPLNEGLWICKCERNMRWEYYIVVLWLYGTLCTCLWLIAFYMIFATKVEILLLLLLWFPTCWTCGFADGRNIKYILELGINKVVKPHNGPSAILV